MDNNKQNGYNTIGKTHGSTSGSSDTFRIAAPETNDEGCCSSRKGCCSSRRGCWGRCIHTLYPAGFVSELREMFAITWPIVLTQIGQMIIGPISLIFCGHLADPILLDGAALAISMINATCIAVGQGLGTACDTFFSQSFGSHNKKNVGVNLQRAMYIFLLAIIPCFALHINMEAFLVAVGQDRRVSRLCGQYILIFMPGALSFFMYVILSKFIQNQNIVMPNVVIGLVTNGVNALMHYVFLYQWGWSTDGSAIAQTISYVFMFVLTLIYILVSKCYVECWDGWTTESLQDWGKFTRLCIPGMLMLCMEWWGFEIGVFLTGLLGTTELGAQSVVLQIDSIWFQVPLGIQIACAIRVGQYLGAGKRDQAITTARLSLTLVIFVSIIVVILFLSLQYILPYLFTNIEDVAQLVAQLLPIVAIYVFFDGVATACKGVMYGTGRQIYGAVLLFISYYVLALPIGVPLMFLTSLRSAGYWWALAINLVVQAVVLVVIVSRTDWDSEVQKARDRAGLLGELEETSDDEETGLLTNEKVDKPYAAPRRRSRLASASLTYNQVKDIMEEHQQLSTSELICRRVIIFFIMLIILAIGIAVKFLVKLEDPFAESPISCISQNSTDDLNATLSLPFCSDLTTMDTTSM